VVRSRLPGINLSRDGFKARWTLLGSVTDGKKRGLRLRTVYVVAYVAIIILAAAILLPDYWYLFLIVLVIALLRIALFFVPRKVYRCAKCGTEFTPRKRSSLRPTTEDLYSDTSKIKCPKCGSTDVALLKKGSK
jgi:DNA-directed RNA polymerase subunit RPC12/RpoP